MAKGPTMSSSSIIATTTSAGNPSSSSSLSAAQHRIHSLGVSLLSIERCTTEAGRCCDTISRLARQLDSLTSPASDASAILTQASENLASTLWRIKDAREKFDTVPDCEPAIQRLASGAKEAMEASTAIHQRNSTAAAISTNPTTLSSSAIGTTIANRRGGINSGGVGLEEDDEIDAALFGNKLSTFLTEQDIHAAADSMDILRDAYTYFLERPKWKSTPSTLRNIERVHREGVNSMALLLKAILTAAGPACRLKSTTVANISTAMSSVTNKKASSTPSRHEHETAQDTRRRLTDALQKKDLLKSVGEYEDIFPLDSTSLREIRAIMDCLRGDNNKINGSYLGTSSVSSQQQQQALVLSDIPPGTKVVRTEKVGSGFYSNLSKRSINTGYPLLDAYGDARKTVAVASLENFHRQLKAEQKKKIARQPRSTSATTTAAGQITKSITATSIASAGGGGGGGTITNTTAATSTTTVDVDTAARDAVRCLEHAMVVVAGEKTIYRSIISKSVDSSKEPYLSPEYTTACVHAYSYVVSALVDRAMDIIELVFFKEAGIGQQQQQQQQQQALSITTVPTSTSDASEVGAGSPSTTLLSIRAASSAAAAGLRILDGVRILGPSLAKLCELSEYRGDSQQLLAGQLCISIHRTTVKQCARTLENLVKAIQTESSDGDQYTLSSNVVRAIRIISPFVHAYKSVSKRRQLPWDTNIGDDALDIDAFINCLVTKLLSNLQTKARRYTANHEDKAASAKGALFLVNNSFYLLEQFSKSSSTPLLNSDNDEMYALENSGWFKEKVGGVYKTQKDIYLAHWDILRSRLTSVEKNDLVYQKDKLLSLESGRLIKSRFSSFIDDFEELYQIHRPLKVIDDKLRVTLQRDVGSVFLPHYTEFFEKYAKIQFSKKNQESYLKYPPMRVQSLIDDLYEIL